MKITKENIGNLVMFLLEAIIGIILLIEPIDFTKTIILGVGIAAIILGAFNIVKYFKTEAVEAAKTQNLSMGLVLLVIGLFCSFNAKWFIKTFPVLTALYGAVILFTGLKKTQWAVDCYRLNKKAWYVVGASALCTIIFSIIVIINPFKTTVALWRFTGIILIIEALMDIVALICDINNLDINIE